MGITKLFSKIWYRIIRHTNINRCLPFYLAFVTTEKELPTYQHSQSLLLQGQECHKCYGIHSVVSQLPNGLTRYLQEHKQNAAGKAALWGQAEVALHVLL